jgi:hypothetical protein
MNERSEFFAALRQAADPQVVERIEHLVGHGADRDLNRINALAFASAHGLDEEKTIAAFLHAARISAFEMSWNVLCPGCGGVLDSSTSLRSVNKDQYHCALCAAGYEPTLDEMVEVTFTISPRVRRIAAHVPDQLYQRAFALTHGDSIFAGELIPWRGEDLRHASSRSDEV